jgi:hypothetical protein
MPLIKSKSKKAQSENISEMMKSKTFAKGKSKKKKQQMAIAASYATKRAAAKKKK